MSSEDGDATVDTVGSLLAIIAYSLQDALRILLFADKRAWGSLEFQQLRLLEETLEDAKQDFQELPALINGGFYYQNDRKADSLDELRELCGHFTEHSQNFKAWVRAGGPIEPEWAAKTRWLRRELHRAQCRAVRRIHDDLETSSSRPRCLGALIVSRSQQRQQSRISQPESHPHHPQTQQSQRRQQDPRREIPPIRTTTSTSEEQPDPASSGEVAACNSTGVFQRLGPGNRDMAFVCNFCDGFIVWEDLRSMPSTRQHTTSSLGNVSENWSAIGFTHPHRMPSATEQDPDIELEEGSGNSSFEIPPSQTRERVPQAETETEQKGDEKTIIFAPVAIANHLPPEPGEWQAPLLCPLCEEYYYEEQGDGDMDRLRYTQDERGFESVAMLQEHLEWTHRSLIPGLANVAPESSKCAVM
ncbi:hypothetical protein F4861DRAFT_526731 [Xylaria intraflava]|nr:hypothetical protein F4861DRAFT_526731 [Xylaria intraflava]